MTAWYIGFGLNSGSTQNIKDLSVKDTSDRRTCLANSTIYDSHVPPSRIVGKIALCSALSEWEADYQHGQQVPHKILIGTDSFQIIRSCLV